MSNILEAPRVSSGANELERGQRLGEGSQGEVYLHADKERPCVIKVSEKSSDSKWEAYIGSKIQSPFIVKTLDSYQHGYNIHSIA